MSRPLLLRASLGVAAFLAGASLAACFSGCAAGPADIPLLAPPTAIAGRVVGSVRSGPGPVDGATVSLSPSGISTLSDAAGSFVLADIAPGTYLLRGQAPGFNDTSRDVTVLAGRATGGDLGMTRASTTGSVAGRVTDGQVGVGGARVELSGTTAAAVTNQDGTFLFTAVEPGLYTVAISRPGFQSVNGLVRVGPSEQARADLALTRRNDGILTGRVTDGLRGLASCSRQGVVALFVGSQRSELFVPRAQDCAASRGVLTVDDHYRFEGLATGPVILQVAVNGFVTGTKVVNILGGAENNGDVVLTLDGQTAAIAGTVLDDTLLPQPQTSVELSQGSTLSTTTTNSAGRFQFAGLPPGTATLTYTLSTLNTGVLGVTLSAGNTVDGSIVLRK